MMKMQSLSIIKSKGRTDEDGCFDQKLAGLLGLFVVLVLVPRVSICPYTLPDHHDGGK